MFADVSFLSFCRCSSGIERTAAVETNEHEESDASDWFSLFCSRLHVCRETPASLGARAASTKCLTATPPPAQGTSAHLICVWESDVKSLALWGTWCCSAVVFEHTVCKKVTKSSAPKLLNPIKCSLCHKPFVPFVNTGETAALRRQPVNYYLVSPLLMWNLKISKLHCSRFAQWRSTFLWYSQWEVEPKGDALVTDMGAPAGFISYLRSTLQTGFSRSEPCSRAASVEQVKRRVDVSLREVRAKYLRVPAGDLRHTAVSWRPD